MEVVTVDNKNDAIDREENEKVCNALLALLESNDFKLEVINSQFKSAFREFARNTFFEVVFKAPNVHFMI